MNIILLGMPGSGKGTQAEFLIKKYGLFDLQAGKLAREWAEVDPNIRKIVDSGKLISEASMTRFISKYLNRYKKDFNNILFEGYPRFVKQYLFLKKLLGKKGQSIDAIIFLKISEKEAIKRLLARRTCENCGRVYNMITNPPVGKKCKCGGRLFQREDDNEKVIKVRFRSYEKSTKKLVDYAKKEGKLYVVDGGRSIEDVAKDVLMVVDSIGGSDE